MDDNWYSTFPCLTGRTFESWVCPKAESRLRRGGRTRPSLSTGGRKCSIIIIIMFSRIVLDIMMMTIFKRWMGNRVSGVGWRHFVWTYMRLQIPSLLFHHHHHHHHHQVNTSIRVKTSSFQVAYISTSLVLPGSIPKDCISLSIWKLYHKALALKVSEKKLSKKIWCKPNVRK